MTRVFVSHASQDKEAVAKLCAELSQHGIDAWSSFKDIKPGEEWNTAIENALETATHVIVVASQTSIASEYVRAEVEWALTNKKTVIPVLIEQVKLPVRWHTLQHVTLTPDENRADALVALVNHLPKGTKQRFRNLLEQDSHEAVKAFLHDHGDFLCARLWPTQFNSMDLMSREAELKSRWLSALETLHIGFDTHRADFVIIGRGTLVTLELTYLLDHRHHPFNTNGQPDAELAACLADANAVTGRASAHVDEVFPGYSDPVELDLTILAGQRHHYDRGAKRARVLLSRRPVQSIARSIRVLSYTHLAE